MQEAILKRLANDDGEAGVGDLREAALLLSGLPGSASAAITRELTLKGMSRERILFCDYL